MMSISHVCMQPQKERERGRRGHSRDRSVTKKKIYIYTRIRVGVSQPMGGESDRQQTRQSSAGTRFLVFETGRNTASICRPPVRHISSTYDTSYGVLRTRAYIRGMYDMYACMQPKSEEVSSESSTCASANERGKWRAGSLKRQSSAGIIRFGSARLHHHTCMIR